MYFWNVEVGRESVNKSARLSHDLTCEMFISLLFLEIMEIKQLNANILSDIALDVSCLHLCNTSCIIFVVNGR
jgi:hypothetical protein